MLLRGRIDLFDVNEVNQRIVECKYRITKNGIDVPICKKYKVKCNDNIGNGQCIAIEKYMEEKYERDKDKITLDSWGMEIYDK